MAEIQSFIAKLENMEVRRVKEVEIEIGDKTYKSLQIDFENEEGERLTFKDKDVSNKDKYTKGEVGELELFIATENVVKQGKSGTPYITDKTKITIRDFKTNKKKG